PRSRPVKDAGNKNGQGGSPLAVEVRRANRVAAQRATMPELPPGAMNVPCDPPGAVNAAGGLGRTPKARGPRAIMPEPPGAGNVPGDPPGAGKAATGLGATRGAKVDCAGPKKRGARAMMPEPPPGAMNVPCVPPGAGNGAGASTAGTARSSSISKEGRALRA